jgi:hypothetical protein
MSFSFIIFIPTETSVIGYIPDSLDVNDSLHRRTPSGDRDEIVALGDCASRTLSAESSASTTATTELPLLTRGGLGRTKVDLTGSSAESSRTASPSTTRAARSPALSLHSLAKRAHPCRVASLTHRIH